MVRLFSFLAAFAGTLNIVGLWVLTVYFAVAGTEQSAGNWATGAVIVSIITLLYFSVLSYELGRTQIK